jgi:hypothetical protein
MEVQQLACHCLPTQPFIGNAGILLRVIGHCVISLVIRELTNDAMTNDS